MKIIDTHSHFNLRQFDEDRADAIGRLEAANMGTICVGVDMESSEFAVRLARDHAPIWATVGQHPTEWEKKFEYEEMKELAQNKKVVAIGECGLDYYRETERGAKEEQKELFKHQIILAQELDLPLMLHIRPKANTMDAYEDALEILKVWKEKWTTMRGTVHFFVGDIPVADQFISLGFYVSFSGVITIFPEYEPIVYYVPLEYILPETDAPFAAPAGLRGKRNEPIYVTEIIKKIASVKSLTLSDVEKRLRENVKNLFKI